jgi:acyl-coenzyme A thioesterase PaaI-like protein
MLVCGSSLRRDLSSKTDSSGVVLPHHHSIHAVHGSVYFKALDDAAFFAVNSLVEDVFVLTA